MNEAENIYLNRNEHYRAVLEVETREDRFIKKVKKEFPLHEILRSNLVKFVTKKPEKFLWLYFINLLDWQNILLILSRSQNW